MKKKKNELFNDDAFFQKRYNLSIIREEEHDYRLKENDTTETTDPR